MGEELGNCINEKLDGKAEVLFGEAAARHRRQGGASRRPPGDALEATAPDAKIVATRSPSPTGQPAQTDVGSALQGNPDVNAVIGAERRGRARCPRRLRRGRQGAPLPHRDRRQRRGAGRRSRTARSTPRSPLQFAADMAQSFDALVNDDRPTRRPRACSSPSRRRSSRPRADRAMTTPADQPTTSWPSRATGPAAGAGAGPHRAATCRARSRSWSSLARPRHLRPVGTADRGLRVLVLAVLLQRSTTPSSSPTPAPSPRSSRPASGSAS